MGRLTPEEMREQIREYEEKKARKANLENEILAGRGFPIIVASLIVINVIILVIMEAAGGSTKIPILYRFGAQSNSAVSAGEYWRLFSSMFLHIGFTHLLFNCLALFLFGRIVELLYGRYKFLAIYFISGYIGNILFLAFGSPYIVSAGASGAIFGIIGAHIPLNRRLKQTNLFADRRRAAIGAGYVVWMFFRSMGAGVNILAHLGGVLAGIALGFVLCPEIPSTEGAEEIQAVPAEEQKRKRITQSGVIGLVLIALTLASFLMGGETAPYGDLLSFNGGQLFYTSAVSRAEATRLGEYLVDEGFFDGNPISAQLDKSGDIYQLRVVVREGIEKDQKNVSVFGMLGAQISKDVFDDNMVEVHLCDNNLKTIKVADRVTTPTIEIDKAIRQLDPARRSELTQKLLEITVTGDPNNAQAHLSLGSLYRSQGRLDEAIAEYREVIRIKPDHAKAHGDLAYLYEQNGMIDEAITEYEKAVEFDPDWAWALNNLAWQYVKQENKLDMAVTLAEKAVELEPESTASLDTLGWAYWKTDETQAALDTFQRVLILKPQIWGHGGNSLKGVWEITQSGIEPEMFSKFYDELTNTETENGLFRWQLVMPSEN